MTDKHGAARSAVSLLILLAGAACGGDSGDPTAPEEPDGLMPTLSSIQTHVFDQFFSVHHGPAGAAADLDLSSGQSFTNLVNVSSTQVELNLVHKVEGRAGIVGRQMPIGTLPLTNEEIDAIRQWINAGTRNN